MSYVRALYPVGAALVLFPLSDIFSRFFPANLHNLQWRFAVLGLGMSSMSVMIIGVALLGLVAAMRENRPLLRVLAIYSALIAIALLAALGLFGLDTLQLRGLVRNPAAKPQITKMAVTAGIAGVLHLIAFISLTIGLWRATRRMSAVKASSNTPAAPVIVYSGAEKARV